MSDKVEFIDYRDTLKFQVGNWLLQKGFCLASYSGDAKSLLEISEEGVLFLGILWKNPADKPTERLFGVIKRDPRRRLIGRLWLSEKTDVKWIIRVCGREHVELVKQLAEDMALAFNVKFSVFLESERPVFELYPGEGGGE